MTTRVDTNGELRRLWKSGARYVIVRPPHVVDVEALRGKRVFVPRAAAGAPFVTVDDVVRSVVDAIRDRQLMGVTPWRAKVGRWLKQPVLHTQARSPALSCCRTMQAPFRRRQRSVWADLGRRARSLGEFA